MDRPRGPLETLASRLGIVAYVAVVVTIVREWGEWGTVWKAVAAGVLASPVGVVVAGLVLAPIAIVVGMLTPIKDLGLLRFELVSIGPLVGIGWACYLLVQSLGG